MCLPRTVRVLQPLLAHGWFAPNDWFVDVMLWGGDDNGFIPNAVQEDGDGPAPNGVQEDGDGLAPNGVQDDGFVPVEEH